MKEEFWCLIDSANTDVIIGSEAWLRPDISDGEVFPPESILVGTARMSVLDTEVDGSNPGSSMLFP